jgi:hypothetical protein
MEDLGAAEQAEVANLAAGLAKKRANEHFLKKTTEGYREALAEYSAAIELARLSRCPLFFVRRWR